MSVSAHSSHDRESVLRALERISSTKARTLFADLVSRVSYGRERVVINKSGKDVVAMVPMEDLRLIVLLEDLIDGIEAERAMATPKAEFEDFAEVRKRLGL